jgi:hypothetical protein
MRSLPALAVAVVLLATGCGEVGESSKSVAAARLGKYATVELKADLSHLSDAERQMLPLLIEAAKQMDSIFWKQAYGEADILREIDDPATKRYAAINYGPWDRLEGDDPFVDGVGKKPLGANLYPADMTVAEFETAVARDHALRSLYTLVRRGDDGSLIAVPYHEAFASEVAAAAEKLRAAAQLAEDPGLKTYLVLRADAMLTDEYRESDLAWLDMKDNTIDIVIGPIETYEDQLLGYKAAHEGYVLIKDKEWSERLSRFSEYLPGLQRGLPVPEEYKSEMPGTDAELNAYDLVYAAGDGNAGSKSIAINLPNDESVQLEKGTRRLQPKNAMRAKFDKILVPIADELIAEDQREHISFRLFEAGLLTEGDIRDNYVTFVASVFRSVRFGASSAHGKANMVRFNFFEQMGAFTRDETTGTYRVDMEKTREAITALSGVILTLQGKGDYEAAAKLIGDLGVIGPMLRGDLDRLESLGIPVDIVFEQGMSILETT